MRAILAFVLLAFAFVAPARATPLLTPAELQALLAREDAVVLDIRPAEGKDSHAAGHIPGAVSAPYDSWRGPKENPGLPLSEDALTERLRAAGVTFERPVVVVHQGADHDEFGAAARVYWTLKSAGHDKLSILNGGHAAWVAAGLPVTSEPTVVARSDATPAPRGDWTATREEVAAAEAGDGDAILVDARPDEFFRGLRKHNAASEPGTLFGALSFTHAAWFGDKPTPVLTAPEDAVARARALSDDAGGAPIVSFCNTGHWAATNWFVLSELLGVENVKLYPESVVGWTRAGLPLSPGS